MKLKDILGSVILALMSYVWLVIMFSM